MNYHSYIQSFLKFEDIKCLGIPFSFFLPFLVKVQLSPSSQCPNNGLKINLILKGGEGFIAAKDMPIE